MTSSIRLLLEEFLGLMREEGELDAFLPVLLTAMNHEIVTSAQKGPRQYGVDIVSIDHTDSARPVLCLWLVKRGQIGRPEWNGGPVQAVKPTIDDVETFIATHRRTEHKKLPIRLVIVTNGDFLSNIALEMATYLAGWERRNKAKTLVVNGSLLASWTEKALLDEHILNGKNKSLLRRTLATIETPEIGTQAGCKLIDELLGEAGKPQASMARLKKQQLHGLRAVRAILKVTQIWGQDAGNLTVPYRLAEYALLCTWSAFHKSFRTQEYLAVEYTAILSQLLETAFAYHRKLQPFYSTEDAFATQLKDNVLLTEAVFSELGRAALQGLIWAYLHGREPSPISHGMADFYAQIVRNLLQLQNALKSPCYDFQAYSIHAAMLFLFVTSQQEVAHRWLHEMILRLQVASTQTEYWPSTASFEDLLYARHGLAEMPHEALRTSILLPTLLVWVSTLQMEDAYSFVRERIFANLQGMTLNFWSSLPGYDSFVSSPERLFDEGIAELITSLPSTTSEFLAGRRRQIPGAEKVEDMVWYQEGAPYIPLLASQFWNLQLPREMLVPHVDAVCAMPAYPSDDQRLASSTEPES